MRVYVVLDLQTRNIYGITDELWLAKLFYVQRNRFLNNLFILRRKDKYLTKRGLSNHDLKINYLSGYAVLNYELEFIESEMLLAGFTYFKYRDSKVEKLGKSLKRKKKEYRALLVRQCIENPKTVFDYVILKREYDYKLYQESHI